MKICLFGSGSKNINQSFLDIGYQLGEKIALNNYTLVFGGGNSGMMGSVARGCYDNKGKVIGIMPDWMGEFEELFECCDEIIYTKTMNERKIKFIDTSDSFIISPGGIGTLDEFFEVLTLKKLKKHDKPIIILNVNHFYDNLINMLDEMVELGFISEDDKTMIHIANTVDECIEKLSS